MRLSIYGKLIHMNFKAILLWVINKYPGLTGHELVDAYFYKCEEIHPDAFPPPINDFLDDLVKQGIVEDRFIMLDMELCVSVHVFYIKNKKLALELINSDSIVYTDLKSGEKRYSNICAN